MFIDRVTIHVEAGSGGNGCHSMYRDMYTRKGIPDGGHGGKGGDVVLIADENVQTLLDFYYRHLFKAHRGKHGSGKDQKGEDGKPLLIKVPLGTVIVDMHTNVQLSDMTEHGQMFIAAHGGVGGRGNTYKQEATPGHLGESKDLVLQLKLIADIGIVGLPNVGKSSIISKISNAKPEIADYAFTTKSPVLGVIQWKDYTSSVIADIPGLIKGAHEGKGLGHEFLRHIERTRLILHVIELNPYNQRDPFEDYKTINQELKCHSENLARLPQIIVGNKIDIPGSEKMLSMLRKKLRKKIIAISAVTKEGIPEMIEALYKKVILIRRQGKQ